MLDTATGLHYFIGRHGGVTDKYDVIVAAVSVHDIKQRQALVVATAIVIPDWLINEIMEIPQARVTYELIEYFA